MKKITLIASLLMATSLWAEQKTCELIGGSDITIKACILEKENGNLKKKILYLESENELDPDRFHKFIVDTCITKRKETTTFGAYTLTQIITDQDWKCIDDLRGYVSATGTGFGLDGISDAFVESPEKVLFHSEYRGLKVKDIEEFYHVSEWTGGAWWAIRDVFLSKKAPYEIVFEEYSFGDVGVVWKDFDNDGYKEIEIIDTNFLHWRSSTAGSAHPVIYLEYSSDSFKLDKDLTYTKANEKIKNTEPDDLKFYPHESGYDYGWQGHYIPPTLTGIIASLIMAGREEEAKKFLEVVWPDNLTDMELFFSLLKEQVKRSPHWEH